MLRETPLSAEPRRRRRDRLPRAGVGTNLLKEGVVRDRIPAGHKVATRAIAKRPAGAPPPDHRLRHAGHRGRHHVHVHNLRRDFARDYQFGKGYSATHPRTSPRHSRHVARASTRNYVGVLDGELPGHRVEVCRGRFGRSARRLSERRWRGRVTHTAGCAWTRAARDDILRRTSRAARHANFAGVLIIGLGCEANQMDALAFTQGLREGPTLAMMTIQESGGTVKAVAEGVRRIREMLPVANQVRREIVPASHIVVIPQGGGSDGYSGITANPALGAAVDLLVQNGGTAILSETPEIYGAEHLLTRRAVNRDVGQKIVDRIHWWEEYTARNKGEMNNNPSPGNKAGGLTTILEKSLGAVAKGGTTGLMDVYEYAKPVTSKGFVFMDTPGYDPVSATGQVAGGANMICFTTGRGSVRMQASPRSRSPPTRRCTSAWKTT